MRKARVLDTVGSFHFFHAPLDTTLPITVEDTELEFATSAGHNRALGPARSVIVFTDRDRREMFERPRALFARDARRELVSVSAGGASLATTTKHRKGVAPPMSQENAARGGFPKAFFRGLVFDRFWRTKPVVW